MRGRPRGQGGASRASAVDRHQAALAVACARSASDVPVADQLGQGHRGDDPARARGQGRAPGVVELQLDAAGGEPGAAARDPVAGVEGDAALADVGERPRPGARPTPRRARSSVGRGRATRSS